MNSRRLLFLCLASAVVLTPLVGHSQSPRTATRPAPAATRPTFAETIAPIVYANCVTCHRPGEAAPFSLISYEDVAKRGALIARVTEARYMPPWHAEHGYGEFVGERRLTDAQSSTIAAWVKQGMPEGDPAKAPAPPQSLPLRPASSFAARVGVSAPAEEPEEEGPQPERGDLVEHFAFGRAEVLSVDGERLVLRDLYGPGRIREIALDRLTVKGPLEHDGKRLFRLDKR